MRRFCPYSVRLTAHLRRKTLRDRCPERSTWYMMRMSYLSAVRSCDTAHCQSCAAIRQQVGCSLCTTAPRSSARPATARTASRISLHLPASELVDILSHEPRHATRVAIRRVMVRNCETGAGAGRGLRQRKDGPVCTPFD